jgi:putative mRNA 3-end processing factor
MPHPATWLKVLPEGLYCEPGGFFIDPVRPVDRAVITHAHSDHARPGHGAALASRATMALMDVRMGAGRAGLSRTALGWGETVALGDVRMRLEPAGHVLGSAQVVMDHAGSRAVVSGDYKRRPDPTCDGFVPVPCDVFVTEATFALPVFRHPPADQEIGRLLASVALFPERTHVIGCYALGKCQRLIALLRAAGWDAPIYLHGALMPLCVAYEALGVRLGELRPATVAAKDALRGAIVLAPPGAIQDRWARRLADPVVCLASGWMRVRQRAKSRGVELPLVISDHADWDELLATLDDVGAPEVWVTHGREEALIHAAEARGITARALRLIGYGDEDDDGLGEEAAPGAAGATAVAEA